METFPTIEECEVKVVCEEESITVEEAFPGEEELCAEINEQVKEGNGWRWCSATVEVSWQNFKGRASMSGLSYESEEEFRLDDYFFQLKEDAFEELLSSID